MLLLVDGSSYLYRAFHALPDLKSRTGQPTGAIYGVINMLRRLVNDYPQATRRAVVFDAKGKTFREDWYPEYKAHRPPMPEELVAQIEPLHALIRALGWPLLCIEGVEADDVIATLATQAAAQGEDCVISTGDKDLAQLVDRHITLVNTMTNEKLDVPAVEEKFGVPPQRINDYLALVGDAVDNVPGVAKVGPKTAAKWLQQYGSLDALIAHADEIGGVVGENLRKHLDFLPLGRKLVTVVRDLDLPALDLTPTAPDIDKLRALYAELDFKSWLAELDSSKAGAAETAPAPLDPAHPDRSAYECILTEAQLDAWLARIMSAELVAFDTETTALDPMAAKLVGLSFAIAPGEAAYLPLSHSYAGAPAQLPLEATLEKLRPWLESAQHKKLGQHLKYDRHVLANHGIDLCGVHDDTLLESYVLEAHESHELGALAKRHCGLATISYDELTGKGANRISFAQVPIERATAYAAEDADVTLRVHRVLAPRLAAEERLERLYREIELPVAEILFRMERHGVLIDTRSLAEQSDALGRRLLEIEAEAHMLAGQPFNLNSPKQLGEILFERLKLPVLKKTPSGGPSTDEEVLARLAEDYPLPKRLLEHRSLAKLKGTYTDKLPKMVNPVTGRVHTSFSQAVAVTGRLACADPNLQNIPIRTPEGRKIRAAFIAPPGCRLVSADYSQVELRIMAHLSNDAGLLDAFARGEDIHRATAAEVFGVTPLEVTSEQRRAAKAINFGLIYGMSAFGLAKQIGIERGLAQAYIDRYFARYPGVARYMEQTRTKAREQGFVETVFGRRLWLPEIRSGSQGRRQAAERAAINAPMQGTAADLIKLAMINVQNWLDAEKLRSVLILQVHDELVLEVPEDELEVVKEALPKLMSGVAKLAVPLVAEVGVGRNWDEAH
ncbi:DNA polymerase I [Sulfuricystis multivorans]|uniref:DNA polymerase I n=1 Tax=Sulfuricystis multivorans TaxID=2211108 RepID=UPI000F828923|nr:DNA polymerase I [Sulfuricystis multivorans]